MNSFGYKLGIISFFLAVQIGLFAVPAAGQLRKLKVGDKMPSFALSEPNDAVFNFKHGQSKVLMLLFVSANQKQSDRAIKEIADVHNKLQSKGETFEFVAVTEEPNTAGYFESLRKQQNHCFRILVDQENSLWGKLGIIAMPTAVVIGREDKLLWIKAGYGYDFEPAAHAALNKAFGIEGDVSGEELVHVETLDNATKKAKLRRHLKMAEKFEQKGRFKMALEEVLKAKQIDPNNPEVSLELGLYYCKTGQSDDAIVSVSNLIPQNQLEEAKVKLINGWAKRQLNDLEAAEKLLSEATRLDPKSSRAAFELGKVYQAKGQLDKAVHAYRRALSIIFEEPIKTENSHP